jgi:ABC-type transport system substrate-binding protein
MPADTNRVILTGENPFIRLSANDGEADWWENPPLDIVPVLAANPDITIAPADPLPSPLTVKFNHLLPPFDNVKMRQAVLAVTDQTDFLSALAGDAKNWGDLPVLLHLRYTDGERCGVAGADR